MGHSGGEAEAQEGIEQLRDRNRRVLECLTLTADCFADGSRSEVVQMGDKLIRMLDLDSVSVENLFGEILYVVRDDDPRL